MTRVRLVWPGAIKPLSAVEPDDRLVARQAARLCAWYNAQDNASMMDGSGTMTTTDVKEFWRDLRAEGGRGFFAYLDRDLVGDADLRRVRDGAAEFAVMIGPSAHKGRGIGRALAVMVHVFAFRDLGLERIYVPARRDNARMRALNAFLGHVRDDSDAARAYADGPDCETYSLSRAAFADLHADAWRDVVTEDAP